MDRVTKKTTSKEIIKLCMLVCSIAYVSMGCAPKPLTKEDKVSIKSVSICEDVEITSGIKVNEAGVDMPYMGKSFVKALKYEARKRDKQARIDAEWQYIFAQSGIDLAKIVKDQFEDQLKKSDSFHSIVDTEADAEFKLEIRSYGFRHVPYGRGWETVYGPALGVIVHLVRPDGTLVWKGGRYISPFTNSETPVHSKHEYRDNPELIRDAFTGASKTVCGEIVNRMVGK